MFIITRSAAGDPPKLTPHTRSLSVLPELVAGLRGQKTGLAGQISVIPVSPNVQAKVGNEPVAHEKNKNRSCFPLDKSR